ncbi:methylated-DNA--[protein]-cysteine S-methyltransferase [Brevibacterium daeguense]|uniref:Methylated-DNA--protein-cysteine methyltransferase n=1 Tax=Brevibacterium daeguense TaxID=909936 RepID=A0ABP8EG65_9MICO|nr:methylated-DNA--[protein]-cysteine S-methyltransferase [Brevibacterium daeguense]
MNPTHWSVRDASDSDALFPVTEAEMAKLHDRLAESAVEQALVDVAYRTVDSPIGPMLLAVTEKGLVRVAFENEGFDAVLEQLSARISPRVLEVPRRLDRVAQELDEYFAGSRRSFDIPLDYRLSGGFRQLVQRHLPQIEYGQTLTYKQVAELVGRPTAVRAVGTACATNPLPVVVPCHRVLRTDGGLGGYLGGLEAKSALLLLEKAA